MTNQPTRNRGIVQRRHNTTSTTSRRTSLFAFACTIPFALWQHTKLMDRLDGGGEYAAEFFTTDDEYAAEETSKEVTWGDSMQQAVDVVKFVAYGSGELNKMVV